jgi:hypothetical protein
MPIWGVMQIGAWTRRGAFDFQLVGELAANGRPEHIEMRAAKIFFMKRSRDRSGAELLGIQETAGQMKQIGSLTGACVIRRDACGL